MLVFSEVHAQKPCRDNLKEGIKNLQPLKIPFYEVGGGSASGCPGFAKSRENAWVHENRSFLLIYLMQR